MKASNTKWLIVWAIILLWTVGFWSGYLFESADAAEAPTIVKYDTIEQAATAALQAVAKEPTSLYYEFGGAIVKVPGDKYVAVPATTDFSGDSVQIDESVGLFLPIVGSYHTHPCLPAHYVEYFSPDDLQESLYHHRIVFMGDFCTGNVHEFMVGDKPDAEDASDAQNGSVYLTKGRIIGAFTSAHDKVIS